MTSKIAVLLAAGKGTRMRSSIPKVLHQLCGKAMVSHVLDAAIHADYSKVLVVVPPEHEEIKKTLGETVTYAVQARPLGSGDALLSARDVLPSHMRTGPVTVLAADVPLITSDWLREMQMAHEHTRAKITLLTAVVDDPTGLGRIVRGLDHRVERVVEEADASDALLDINEINTGIYIFDQEWLWSNLEDLEASASGEIYITDLVATAANSDEIVGDVRASGSIEAMGVNNRVQLARAEAKLQDRIRERWMLAGVTMPDPDTVYLDATVSIGQDTVIRPNTHLLGDTHVGEGCEIGPNSMVVDSVLADGCRVVSSSVKDSKLSEDVSVGPFSNVRAGTILESRVRVGNFTEIKNSHLGEDTRALHLSYIGDADIGSGVNVGAGVVTCNFDGKHKHPTKIGNGASVGAGTMLVAPVEVGEGASTGAGSVVTKDVPADELVAGVPARIIQRTNPQVTEKEG